jgi:hypothetical protein
MQPTRQEGRSCRSVIAACRGAASGVQFRTRAELARGLDLSFDGESQIVASARPADAKTKMAARIAPLASANVMCRPGMREYENAGRV